MSLKHEIYQKEQEDLQKKVAMNIADSLAKQRNKRETNYLKLRKEVEVDYWSF